MLNNIGVLIKQPPPTNYVSNNKTYHYIIINFLTSPNLSLIKSFNPDNSSFSPQNNHKKDLNGSIDIFETNNLNSNFNPPCYRHMYIHEIIYNYVYMFILDMYEFLMILVVFFFG